MSSIWRILRATRILWPAYGLIILCGVLTALAALGTPFVLKYATDAVVQSLGGHGGSPWQVVLLFAGLYLGMELFSTLVSNLGGYVGDVMSQRMRTLLSTRYFHQLLSLPQSYFDTQLTGTVISRLNRSIAEVTQFLKTISNNFFPTIVTTVAVLVIMAVYYWPLAVLLLVIYPSYLWLTGLTSKKWQGWEREKNEHVDLAGGRFNEAVSQLRVVKSFATQARELFSFSSHYAATVELTRHQSAFWHRMDVFRRAVLNLVFFGMYLIIFWKTMSGQFSLGDMVLMLQLMAMAAQPVSMLSWIIDAAQRAVAGSREYFEVMEAPQDPRVRWEPALLAEVESAGGRTRSETAAEQARRESLRELAVPPRPPHQDLLPDPVVRLEQVDFAYQGEEDVVRGVDLEIRRGEKIAFVGESGGGKSTLMALLQGLYLPHSGTVEVAGIRTDEARLGELRAAMGMVFQEASLFSGTIAENIAYARPEASREEVVEAARQANADDFVRGFAHGYDTLIGERGLKLSGGQKQRIAVARAILKDAPILILDEATSALDTKSERAVQEALERLMVGRTSLIIAHRLSTVSAVDRIVTVSQGRIEEIGTPQELAQSGGIYAQLLQLQTTASAADQQRMKRFGIIG